VKHPEKLTDAYIKKITAKKRDFHIPTNTSGLTLYTSPHGCKSWPFWYRFNGKAYKFSLGRWPVITADMAFRQAMNAKLMIHKGINPKFHRQKLLVDCESRTFEIVAIEWHKAWSGSGVWQTPHALSIERLLNEHVYPAIGQAPIDDIDGALVLSVLRATQTKTTAGVSRRVKQIMGQIFRYAVSCMYCPYNPTPDTTDFLPPKITDHRPAIIDVKNARRLMSAIAQYNGSEFSTALLKLHALLFLRPIEMRALEWDWIDWEEKRILISGHIIKNMSDTDFHTVPLARQSLAILRELQANQGHQRVHVFYNQKDHSKHISEHVVRYALNKIGFNKKKHTAHGFRATARTLIDESLACRPEWIELQLAHKQYDANAQAYRRGTFIEERIKMMQSWADYVEELAGQPFN